MTRMCRDKAVMLYFSQLAAHLHQYWLLQTNQQYEALLMPVLCREHHQSETFRQHLAVTELHGLWSLWLRCRPDQVLVVQRCLGKLTVKASWHRAVPAVGKTVKTITNWMHFNSTFITTFAITSSSTNTTSSHRGLAHSKLHRVRKKMAPL